MAHNQVDVLLTPTNIHAATKAENIKELGSLSYYNWLANLCDLPAGVVPVSLVREGEDLEEYKDGIEDNLTRILRKDFVGSVGLPLGVQVIGLQYEDEKVLGVMKVIEDAVGFNPSPQI